MLVDPGATYATLPRDVLEAFGSEPIGTRRVRLGDGREEEWPVTFILVKVDGREAPTLCLVGPRGGPALLGAVALEELALGMDPVARRLVPVISYLV